jgi:hypothetical protein
MCCGPQSIGGVMERWTDNFLNRAGIRAVYTQTSDTAQTITLSYVPPAPTGTEFCDLMIRLLPSDGSMLGRPGYCFPWIDVSESNPATSAGRYRA